MAMWLFSSLFISSAPASAANSKKLFSSHDSVLYFITPFLLKTKFRLPVSPNVPPFLLNADLISEAVLFLLSVKTSIITATLPGP